MAVEVGQGQIEGWRMLEIQVGLENTECHLPVYVFISGRL